MPSAISDDEVAFLLVPSMMPRHVLKDNFHLTYRKIPVLAIGNEVTATPLLICMAMLNTSRQIYCDTSLIIEVLEYRFSDSRPSVYPPAADGKTNRALIRGFASYWTDVRACTCSSPNRSFTKTATLVPRYNRFDSFESLAYRFRYRPCWLNRPQAQSGQARSKGTAKSF